MRNPTLKLSLVAAASFALIACTSPGGGGAPADTASVLSKANAAMGSVSSLRYAGTGTGSTFGQAYVPDTVWPRLNYSAFSRVIDYNQGAMREEFARSRAEERGGGGIPLMGEGEQRAVSLVSGDWSWNQVGPAPVPAPVARDVRVHDLWTTPHGVLKAAAKNKASATQVIEAGKSYSVLSFSEAGRFSAKAYVNEQGLVERVESRLPNPVLGESSLVTNYSDYRDFSGLKFPARIRQTQEGVEVLNLDVKEAQAGAPFEAPTPDLVRNFAERAVGEVAAPGVWYLAGGSHHSVAIEMKDHLIVVESPLYDGRAQAAMTEAKRLAPGKPIRYVVNSHHHFDHAGGLRAAAAEGATVITSGQAAPFFQRAFAQHSVINPDALTKSGKRAAVEGFGDKRVLSDGSRQVELHQIQGSVHAQGFTLVYLPAERLLIQADAYTPLAPNAPAPAKPNANHVNLIDNIERLGLKVDRILPLHGRMVPLAELYATAGRRL